MYEPQLLTVFIITIITIQRNNSQPFALKLDINYNITVQKKKKNFH